MTSDLIFLQSLALNKTSQYLNILFVTAALIHVLDNTINTAKYKSVGSPVSLFYIIALNLLHAKTLLTYTTLCKTVLKQTHNREFSCFSPVSENAFTERRQHIMNAELTILQKQLDGVQQHAGVDTGFLSLITHNCVFHVCASFFHQNNAWKCLWVIFNLEQQIFRYAINCNASGLNLNCCLINSPSYSMLSHWMHNVGTRKPI